MGEVETGLWETESGLMELNKDLPSAAVSRRREVMKNVMYLANVAIWLIIQ